jgi:hypothetical protein
MKATFWSPLMSKRLSSNVDFTVDGRGKMSAIRHRKNFLQVFSLLPELGVNELMTRAEGN